MKMILYQIKNYFKFVNLQYILSLKELYNSFEYEYDLYIKVSENLKNKKETLYNNKEFEKWELKKEDINIDFNDKDLVINKIYLKKQLL
jgi:hypothetical protein